MRSSVGLLRPGLPPHRNRASGGVRVRSIEEYGREIVAAQPTPRRHVALWPLVYLSYGSPSGRVVTGVGLVLGLPVVVVGILANGGLPERIVLLSISGVTTTALLTGAGVRAWRMRNALRRGTACDGRVLRSQWFGPRLRAATLDAQKHGMTRGTWRVSHPLGDFDEAFESDAAWASSLTRGTHVRVLVDPNRQHVLLALGPVDVEPR